MGHHFIASISLKMCSIYLMPEEDKAGLLLLFSGFKKPFAMSDFMTSISKGQRESNKIFWSFQYTLSSTRYLFEKSQLRNICTR